VAETQIIRIRYWAAAKSAAGTALDDIPVNAALTLTELRDAAVRRHPGTDLAEVLAVCSALVDDRPVGSADPGSVLVEPGASVEFLPPFAGG
jgi:sulfur-carrier protein